MMSGGVPVIRPAPKGGLSVVEAPSPVRRARRPPLPQRGRGGEAREALSLYGSSGTPHLLSVSREWAVFVLCSADGNRHDRCWGVYRRDIGTAEAPDLAEQS